MNQDLADIQHTFWSNPEGHRARLSELPGLPAAIADSLEELVVHHEVARQIGVRVPAAAEADRSLRRVSLLLTEALGRDPRHLTVHRDISDYLYVTCRDFALLAVSALRERGIPARLRVGFASYFNPRYWEDHWVCEYRLGETWAILDAQLGPRARAGFRIAFDVAQVPDTGWRCAASVWRAVRSGQLNPDICGLPYAGIEGEWWIGASVIRDAAVLAGIECLPWDYWGLGRAFFDAREVRPEQAHDIDLLAEAIEPAPRDRREAEAVLARFPWACPTQTELALLEGRAEIGVSRPDTTNSRPAT